MNDGPIIFRLDRNLEASKIFTGALHAKGRDIAGHQLFFCAVDVHKNPFTREVDDDACARCLGRERTVDGETAIGATGNVLGEEHEEDVAPAGIKAQNGGDFSGIVFGESAIQSQRAFAGETQSIALSTGKQGNGVGFISVAVMEFWEVSYWIDFAGGRLWGLWGLTRPRKKRK